MGASFLGFLAVVSAVLVIYHLWTKNDRLTDTEKLIWTIAAVLFSVITGIVYYFSQYRKFNP